MQCKAAAETAAFSFLRTARGIPDDLLQAETRRAPASIAAAAAWALEGSCEPSCTLFALMISSSCCRWLPQLLVPEVVVKEPLPATITQEYKDLIRDEGYQDYLAKAVALSRSGFTQQPQDGSLVCRAFWQRVLEMHHRKIHDPPIKIQTLQTQEPPAHTEYWSHTDEEVSSELARQGAPAVDVLFCIRWHLREAVDDDFSRPLEKSHFEAGPPGAPHPKWRTRTSCPETPRAEDRAMTTAAGVAASACFVLLGQLGYVAPDDGSATILEAVLARVHDASLHKPCLLALELLKFGQLDGAAYDSIAGCQRTEEERFLLRTAALLPVRLQENAAAPASAYGDEDLRAFATIAGVLARAIQLVAESALLFVLTNLWDSADGEAESEFGQAVSSMSFELPQSGAGMLMAFFLEYAGEPELFVGELSSRFWYCVKPLDDLLRAFDLWKEVCACVDRFPDLNQQNSIDSLQRVMTAATQLVSKRREFLGL